MNLKPFLTQSFDSPKSALIAIINHFESDQELYYPDKILQMSCWEKCIIGVLNWGRSWSNEEEHILTNFLGLDLNGEYADWYCYFKGDQNNWSDEDWKYFKFFTSAVEPEFDTYHLKDWIDQAKNVLNET